MGYKVLYRKYRPLNFSELVGQDPIKESLINAINKNQLAHAYIFTGPRGTGKTSTAKIFAKALTCLNPLNGDSCGECINCQNFNENPDIIEIDAASNNGVDEIREIRNNVKLVPTMSKYKIYIIDEVHMLSQSAWNAFLKTLEEPPSHVIFIFATTDIQKVPLTVLSRCQRYDFHRIKDADIESHIKKIANIENFNIEDTALKSLVNISDGCLRDCLSYLDQLSKVTPNITMETISNVLGTLDEKQIYSLICAIKKNDLEAFLTLYSHLKEKGVDCANLIDNMVEFLVKEATNIKLNKSSDIASFDLYYRIIQDLFDVESKIKNIDNPYNLFLITFLNYFFLAEEEKKEVSATPKIVEEKEKNISREINSEKDDEKLRGIRVNNVFCKANKKAKSDFAVKWEQFLEVLTEENNYAILGYINGMEIQVVSDEYTLFSTKTVSDSVIFNKNLENIENEFNKQLKSSYKFISLDWENWNKAKDYFIKNKDKKWTLMDESLLKNKEKNNILEVSAKDIFGDVIEIK